MNHSIRVDAAAGSRTALTCVAAALALAATLPLLAGCAPSPEPGRVVPRVILLAVDGADWEVIDRLLADGQLPNLARMKAEGAHGILESHEPIFSPVVWASIATGKGPADHGITSFTVEGAEGPVPVTSNLVESPRLWEILSEADRTVGVIGWWTTWPAEPVQGFLCSDRSWPLTMSEHGMPVTSHEVPEVPRRTFPEDLQARLDSLVLTRHDLTDAHLELVDVAGSLGTVDNRGPAVADVLAKDLTFRRFTHALYPTVRPDFFTLYLELPDVMSHYFWDSWRYSRLRRFGEPTRFDTPPKGMPPELAEYVGVNFERSYALADRVLGELVEMADDSTMVVVVSDHGYGENEDGRELHIGDGLRARNPHWHRLDGVILAAGCGVAPGTDLGRASVFDVAPTLLHAMGVPVGADMAGSVLEALFASGFRRPVRTVPSHDAARRRGDAPSASPGDEGMLELLRSLGYVR